MFAAVAIPRPIFTGVVALTAASLLDNSPRDDLQERRQAAPGQFRPLMGVGPISMSVAQSPNVAFWHNPDLRAAARERPLTSVLPTLGTECRLPVSAMSGFARFTPGTT